MSGSSVRRQHENRPVELLLVLWFSPLGQGQDVEHKAQKEQYAAGDVRALRVHAQENAERDKAEDGGDPLDNNKKADQHGNHVHDDANDSTRPRLSQGKQTK